MSGPWLGEYDQFLLTKLPFYGIWLAFLFIAGIPLRIAEFFSFVLLVFLFKKAWQPIIGRMPWLNLFVITILLVGLPQLSHELRLIRNVLNAILAEAVLISVIGYVIRAAKGSSMKSQIRWGLLVGFFYALFYLTREDSVFLLPVILCAYGFGSIMLLRKRKKWDFIIPGFLGVLMFFVPVFIICQLNAHYYGVQLTALRRSTVIHEMYSTLKKVMPDTHERFVLITTKARLAAYTVSPTFSKLAPFLEGPLGDNFALSPPHILLNERPLGTREFFISDFEWSYFQSLYASGAKTAPEVIEMSKKITHELENAFDENRIQNGAARPGGYLAPLLPGDIKRIMISTLRSFFLLYSMKGTEPPRSIISSGAIEGLALFSAISGSSLAPTKETAHFIPKDFQSSVYKKIFSPVKLILHILYMIGSFSALFFGTVSLKNIIQSKNKDLNFDLSIAVLMLLLFLSLVCFSGVMGVLDTLGWPHLKNPLAYNSMGFVYIAVISAFGFTLLVFKITSLKNKDN